MKSYFSIFVFVTCKYLNVVLKTVKFTQYFVAQLIDQSEGVFIAAQLPEFSNSLRLAETAFFRKFLMNCNDFLILTLFLIPKMEKNSKIPAKITRYFF